MKTILIISFTILAGTVALTQDHSPKQDAAPQGREMPNLLPGEPSGQQMPNMQFKGSYGIDDQTSEPHFYLDTDTRLYFDFKNKNIRDFKTGKSYSFNDVRKMLRSDRIEQSNPQQKRL